MTHSFHEKKIQVAVSFRTFGPFRSISVYFGNTQAENFPSVSRILLSAPWGYRTVKISCKRSKKKESEDIESKKA